MALSRIRLLATTFAVIGWSAVLLQLWLTTGLVMDKGGSFFAALVKFFGYFTILSNVFAALVLSAFAIGPGFKGFRPLTHRLTVTTVAASMVIVGAIYWLVLRHQWQPQGWAFVADAGLHDVMPPLMLLFWAVAVPAGAVRWRQAGWLFAYPLAYLVYVFARGEIVGDYPYPFIDVPQIGYVRALINSAGVLVLFAALAGAMLGAKALPARQR